MWIDKDGKRHSTITDTEILGFFDEYRYLSNFHRCFVHFDDMTFTSSEAAYMAQKSLDKEISKKFCNCEASEAKKLGQTVPLRPDWEYYRIIAMTKAVFYKFHLNSQLRELLFSTGEKYLEETNNWNDLFWGVDYQTKQGANMLGKVLMNVRGVLRDLHRS